MTFTITPVFCCSSFFSPQKPGPLVDASCGPIPLSLFVRRRNPEEKNEELSSEEREALQAKAAEVTISVGPVLWQETDGVGVQQLLFVGNLFKQVPVH